MVPMVPGDGPRAAPTADPSIRPNRGCAACRAGQAAYQYATVHRRFRPHHGTSTLSRVANLEPYRIFPLASERFTIW